MPLGMFVNPIPGLRACEFLQFDFPARGRTYRANNAQPNINLLPPAVEQMYGKLGTPAQQQGNPCIVETYPEVEDPHVYPLQDQIVDYDQETTIYHTGRLSGSFVPFIANDQFKSTVRIDAAQIGAGTSVNLATIEKDLAPQSSAINVWFWMNPSNPLRRPELLFTACTSFVPGRIGLKAGELYKLNIRWEFRYYGTPRPVRMGVSGFDETVAFQVSEPTLIP